ncbi:HK97 family phage prohead protease [Agromyces sp. NPDC058064]|uniref:HK97 family phage prohead protease n=1 Tax=Agromyces sp. NPDC058064 TaxID=3346322 RepID=UPI0036DF75F7
MPGMDRLTVPIEWKAAADGSGTLEGYASTFGNVDLGGDIVVKGAFLKTIANIKANGIPLLADHVASTASVLGTIFDAKEDAGGLRFKAQFSSAPSAQDVRIKLLEGHLKTMSIGYEAVDYAYKDVAAGRVRLLKELKLWETSVVVFPMNPEALVSRVKSIAGALDGHTRAALAAELAEKSTANEVRDQLNELVREAYGSDGVDVWIRDFDESKVWFTVMSADETGTFQQDYESDDDNGFTLTGDRMKVRLVTNYVPDGKSATLTITPVDGAQLGDEPGEGEPDEGSQEQAGDDPADGASDEGAHWDRWASEALLNGNDPDAVADPADVAGLRTLLELNETALGLGSTDTDTE